MGQTEPSQRSFFRALAKDITANTLAISAAAVVPLLAMVGGGVDASRYYMAQSRLQAACDAGVLAARQAMGGDNFAISHERRGEIFFDQNYKDGMFGLEDLDREFSASDDGEVLGEASGVMPTALMGIFGYDELDINVACEADINIANTDIMLVLDVTHSMRCPAYLATEDCDRSYEHPDSRLQDLRTSVVSFYDTIQASASEQARIRYGIIPYSTQVNVGSALDASWMASEHTYQSRTGEWIDTYYENEAYDYVRTGNASNWQYQGETTNTYTDLTYDQCVAEAATEFDIYRSSDPSGWTQVSQEGTPPITKYTGKVTWEYYTLKSGSYNSATGVCTLTDYFYLYDAKGKITHYPAGSTSHDFTWVYQPVTYDISNVKANGYLVAPTGYDNANVTYPWTGCIEEASTVNTGDFSPIPANAKDLDIDLVPTTDDEKWKPMLRDLVYYRYTDDAPSWQYTSFWTRDKVYSTQNKQSKSGPCPKPALKLSEIDSRDFLESYLSAANGFVGVGNTYHDIGMIWAGRFISPDGIFASENATAPNGDAISRHVIFMTDGEMFTSNDTYSPYGMEFWDRRLTDDGSNEQLLERHQARFQAACRAVRNKNVSVWVVAFGTELSDSLISCASPGRAFYAADSDALEDAFVEIANQIAALRITE